MAADPDASPLERIVDLAHGIIDECPSCAGMASQIAMWAGEIRERRPDRPAIQALVESAAPGLPPPQRSLLVDSILALVRYAE